MNVLILEDSAERMKQFKTRLIGKIVYHAQTPREAISFLRSKQVDVLFLDHDLGGRVFEKPSDNTGYGVAKWLSENPEFTPGQVIIHSLNNHAAKLMQSLLPGSQVVPFAWQKI